MRIGNHDASAVGEHDTLSIEGRHLFNEGLNAGPPPSLSIVMGQRQLYPCCAGLFVALLVLLGLARCAVGHEQGYRPDGDYYDRREAQ
jgi:hypothetical protein